MKLKIRFLFICLLASFTAFSQTNVKKNYTAPYFQGSVKVGDTLGVVNKFLVDTIKGFSSSNIIISDTVTFLTNMAVSKIFTDTIGASDNTKQIYLDSASFIKFIEFLNKIKVDSIIISGLTASQIVETDGSKFLISVAKGTAYNKSFGSASSTVTEGDDARLHSSTTSLTEGTNLYYTEGRVDTNSIVDSNTTHRKSDGSDHTFIDQSVTSGSSPTFDGANFTGVTADTATLALTADSLNSQAPAYYLSRTNHTGVQLTTTITGFQDSVTANTNVTANTTHKSSDGSDHSFIDQNVTSTGSPTFIVVTSDIDGASPITIDVTGTGNSYAEVIQDNGAGRFNVGRTTATEFSKLSITDGGGDNEPGMIALYDDGGTGHHIWMSTDNKLRVAAPEPTDDDADGFVIIDNDDGTIGASGQQGTFDDVTLADDLLLADGAVVGIPSEENITFTAGAPGTINFSGASVDIDGAFTAGAITSDDNVQGDTAKFLHYGGQSDFTIGTAGENVTIGADTITLSGEVRLGSYTKHNDIIAGAATVGSTAPTPTTVGTYRGLAFDADNEVAHFVVEVPQEWDTTSDMTLVVHWYSEDGDIIQNGETVKWDATYRVTAAGDSVDHNTVVVATTTFTGGASEVSKQHYETSITIDYDNVNQPLVIGSDIGFQFDRDVGTDTYTGDGIVYKWDLVYTANKLATH